MCSKLLHLSAISPMIGTWAPLFFSCLKNKIKSNSKVTKLIWVQFPKDLKMKIKPKNAKIIKHTSLAKDQKIPSIITCISYRFENKPKYTLHKM